jgi:hypothetical protein
MYIRWLLAIVILGLSFGAAYWAGLVARQANQPPPMEVIEGLAVAAADLDMGEVWEEKGIARKLHIRNQTPGHIEIHDIQQTCSCTDIKPRRLSIAAGETATIDLTLDLTHRTYSERGQARRPFAVGIYPVLDPKAQPRLGWRLYGIINSRVTVDTPSIDFGEEVVCGQRPLARKVIATVHVADASLRAHVVPDLATVRLNALKESTSRFELIVAPLPTLPLGPFSFELQLDLITKLGDHLPGVIVPITGRMQPAVRALPARLVFGPQRVGHSVEATVTLQVPVAENWIVNHIETESNDVVVERFVHPDTSFRPTFRVRQRIRNPGHQSSKVRFFVRKGHGDPVTLTMEVSYDGDEEGVLSEANEKEAER